MTNRALSIMAGAALLAGCAQPPDRPSLRVSGSDFFDYPWPSDRRTSDGHPNMSGFPGIEEFDLVAKYISRIERLDGFGTNSPIFLRLDGDVGEMPAIEDTVSAAGPLFLVDIDTQSPERGRIIPLQIHHQITETRWQPAGLVSVRPALGFPLRPRTTYSLVLTTDFIQPVPSFQDVWNPAYVDHSYYVDLGQTLVQIHVPRERVAYAVRFTTQDPVSELARFSARIKSDLSIPALDQALEPFRSGVHARSFDGEMWIPLWQQGIKPYLSDGGNFVFDEDGRPVLQDWEKVGFTFSYPASADMPEDGWPVVIYGHGTGGDQHTFADGFGDLEVANVLARAGLAGLSISLPLHGDRGTSLDPALASFNYLNPDSAISTFRQASLDQIYLAEVLSQRSHAFTIPSGTVVRTDPSRVAYLGHSHGGLTGAMAAPFMGDRLQAVVLSGAGGGLSTSVATRDAGDFDIQGILVQVFGFEEADELDPSHPLLAAVQTVAEITDPINYAPYWFQRSPYWDTHPVSVLMTEGRHDVQTPPDTAEALAAAGGLPILAPAAHYGSGHRYRKMIAISTPTSDNLQAWDGTHVTGGLAQFADQDHFAIFNDEEAAALYQHFLSTALSGTPEVQER